MATFQGKNGGAPYPRTEAEWMEKGYSPEQAAHKMRQDVFGHDYQTDAKGNPIERGKGSIHQPTAQHQQALAISQEAEARRAMTMGWHPGLINAFNPQAAPAAPRRRGPNRKKNARKPAASADPAGEA